MRTENKVVTQEDLDNFPRLVDEWDVQVGDTVSWDYPGGEGSKGAHTDSGDPIGTPLKPPIPPQ